MPGKQRVYAETGTRLLKMESQLFPFLTSKCTVCLTLCLSVCIQYDQWNGNVTFTTLWSLAVLKVIEIKASATVVDIFVSVFLNDVSMTMGLFAFPHLTPTVVNLVSVTCKNVLNYRLLSDTVLMGGMKNLYRITGPRSHGNWPNSQISHCNCSTSYNAPFRIVTPRARFMEPTWGPPGADRTQVGPVWAPWKLLSGNGHISVLIVSIMPCGIWNSCIVGFVRLAQNGITKCERSYSHKVYNDSLLFPCHIITLIKSTYWNLHQSTKCVL